MSEPTVKLGTSLMAPTTQHLGETRRLPKSEEVACYEAVSRQFQAECITIQLGEAENGERNFADIPWSERSHKNTPQPTNSTSKHTNDRSLIILGVPEPNETSNKVAQNTHDYMQLQCLCSTLELINVAVVDTFQNHQSIWVPAPGP
ncbi:hypothetical protein T265_11674 [Opisthorchis viverrini]|uniref:Uncharacterized protein n=1 Tax=Opisthorchis viverrini TaxID=6198 RepID=A0A074Z8Q1_OPIVI|nr:hypothetical protein T265_11674 [Opisthorchis viverrini]KER19600.1 hypothetical protein T265_11674 [Opisthorchis viverrini]